MIEVNGLEEMLDDAHGNLADADKLIDQQDVNPCWKLRRYVKIPGHLYREHNAVSVPKLTGAACRTLLKTKHIRTCCSEKCQDRDSASLPMWKTE